MIDDLYGAENVHITSKSKYITPMSKIEQASEALYQFGELEVIKHCVKAEPKGIFISIHQFNGDLNGLASILSEYYPEYNSLRRASCSKKKLQLHMITPKSA